MVCITSSPDTPRCSQSLDISRIVYLCMIICCIPAAILSATLSYTLRGYGTAQSMFSTDELVTFIELHSDDHAMGNGGPIESRAVALIRNIIQAQEKVVGDISRSIYDVYMVPRSLELSIEQQKRILSSGFSKIPVYETTTEVYEDSGLPKMKFWGYFQTKVSVASIQIIILGINMYRNLLRWTLNL